MRSSSRIARVEAQPTADKKYAQADIGINAKKYIVQAKNIFVHFKPP